MISIKQIRAARALLDWKQSDLAEAVGLSLTAINNIEKGYASPRVETLQKIEEAFKRSGISFLESDGVRFNTNISRLYEGDEAIRLLLDDICASFVDSTADEILALGVDEKLFLEHAGDAFLTHLKRLKELNVTEKLISCYGDSNFVADASKYRWIPKEQFSSSILTYIYVDKVATVLWEPRVQVIITQHQGLADAYRRNFMFMWDNGTVPSQSRTRRMV